MRTIKFRGKRLHDGEWVYGNPLVVDTEERKVAMIVTFHEAYPDILAKVTTSVEFNTLGQFTGLQDANGTDVYEGDIVRYQRNKKTYQVVFKDGIFWGEGNNGCGCAAHFFPACEIIGNVIDNPELIKKGGEHE